MSVPYRNILFAGLALLIVACVCLAVLGVTGAGVTLFVPTPALPTVTALPTAPTATRRPTPILTATTAPSVQGIPPTLTPTRAQLSPQISQEMDQIQQQVVVLRGLQPKEAVNRALITRAELQNQVDGSFFKDYTAQDAQNDQTVLTAFGLLPAAFDLRSFYQKLYAEGIAGYYDNQTKQMYVVQDQGFEGPERLTYAHEYTHALQDQNYDIQNGLGYSDAACKHETERCAGLQALIEGDATLVEQDWLLADSTPLDREQIQGSINTLHTPVYDSAPAFMQQDFLFPYRSGEEFVQSLFDRGGWAAVNQAFQNPPVSTEQILHPDRYPEDQPVSVSLPDLTSALGSGWSLVNQNPMGEWYTYLILAYGADSRTRMTASAAQAATQGWHGDEYAVYSHAGSVEALLASEWDSAQNALQFRNAFAEYGTARWGAPAANQPDGLRWETAGGVVELRLQGTRTTWVMSPDPQTHQTVETALQQK
ncbi:MAG TPA: hypothetical protein VGJ97_06375 [Anaerolineaceae bacterium]